MGERESEMAGPVDAGRTGRNWNPWIVIAIVLVLACICVAAAAALVGGSLLFYDRQSRVMPELGREATAERVVRVSPGTRLEVDNFAGSIDAGVGDEGQIRIVAVKHASAGLDLNRIEVNIEQRGDTLVVRTDRPRGLGNAYVNLQILAPQGTPLDLSTGSGSVEVEGFVGGVRADTGSGSITARSLVGDLVLDSGSGRLTVQDLEGALDAHSGSGGIDVLGATGNVRLDTGSGTIEYHGAPTGECRFQTGSGSVVLHLPAELDFRIQADTGSGSVDVQFEVEGRISRQHVEGVVGTGQEAALIVSTGSGGIRVLER